MRQTSPKEACGNVVFQPPPYRGYTTFLADIDAAVGYRVQVLSRNCPSFAAPSKPSVQHELALLEMPARESHSPMSELTPSARAADVDARVEPNPVASWLGAFWEQERETALLFLDVDGRIRHAGTAAETLFGYARAELCGMPFGELYTKNADGPQAAHDLASARRGAFNDDRCLVRKTGTELWANMTISAMESAAGTPIGFAVSAQDVTARRRSEEGCGRSWSTRSTRSCW